MREGWIQGMTTERMVKEAYRRGGAAMFDMMSGGLSFGEAWRRLSEAAAMETPPNLSTMLEEIGVREQRLAALEAVAVAARAYVEQLERLCPIRSRVGKALIAALDVLDKERDGNPTVP